MRNLKDESLVRLDDKHVSVRGIEGTAYQELLRLKNENNPHLRGWTVERSDSPRSLQRLSYGIYYRDNLVGEVSLREFSTLTCQIAYWLHEPFWGLGITTTAVRLISEHALKNLNVLEILAYVHYSNKASISILQKVGYEEVDTVYKTMFYKNKKEPHLMFTYDKISSR